MAVRQIEYGGMTVKAASFEVVGSGRFVVVFSIARTSARPADRKEKFFEPPSDDGFFDDPDDALDGAIAHAQAIIDGRVPGQSVEDL